MSLGNQVRDTLTQAAQDAFALITAPLQALLHDALTGLLHALEQELISQARPQLERWRDSPGLPAETRATMTSIIEAEHFGWATILVPVIVGMTAAPLLASLQSTIQGVVQEASKRNPTSLLTSAEGIQSYFKGVWDEGRLREELLRNGVNDERISALIDASRPLLGISELRDLYLRQAIDEGEHDRRLGQLGFGGGEISHIKTVYWQIPNPADLVRMAVREAFSPDIIGEFGLGDDFPTEFAEWTEKTGLSREWAQRYWYSHWELPSVSMAFEMLHRGVIDDRQLDLLLRTQDVMPFWREKIKAISYSPLTRVDVRRMYRLGVLSLDEVVRSYKDLGYDDTNARRLADFTAKYESEPERDLSKADIVGAYKDHIITREQGIEMLKTMAYAPEEAEMMLARTDYAIAKSREDTALSAIRNAYLKGVIDEPEVFARLGRRGMMADQMRELVTVWNVDKVNALEQPGVGQLETFFKQRVIDEPTYRAQLKTQGYTEAAVNWYVQSTLFEMQVETEKLTRAELERQRRAVPKPTRSDLRAFYIDGIMTEAEIRQELTGQKFTAEYIDDLLALWHGQAEEANAKRALAELRARKAAITTPSKSDLKAFLQSKLMTEAEVRKALSDQGYVAADISRYLSLFIQAPSLGEVDRQYLNGVLTEAEVREFMGLQGYAESTVNNHIDDLDYRLEQAAERRNLEEQRRRKAEIKSPSKADLKAFLKLQLITIEEFRTELLRQGYEADWVELYVRQQQAIPPPAA